MDFTLPSPMVLHAGLATAGATACILSAVPALGGGAGGRAMLAAGAAAQGAACALALRCISGDVILVLAVTLAAASIFNIPLAQATAAHGALALACIAAAGAKAHGPTRVSSRAAWAGLCALCIVALSLVEELADVDSRTDKFYVCDGSGGQCAEVVEVRAWYTHIRHVLEGVGRERLVAARFEAAIFNGAGAAAAAAVLGNNMSLTLGTFAALSALAGMGLSGRVVWLLHFPGLVLVHAALILVTLVDQTAIVSMLLWAIRAILDYAIAGPLVVLIVAALVCACFLLHGGEHGPRPLLRKWTWILLCGGLPGLLLTMGLEPTTPVLVAGAAAVLTAAAAEELMCDTAAVEMPAQGLEAAPAQGLGPSGWRRRRHKAWGPRPRLRPRQRQARSSAASAAKQRRATRACRAATAAAAGNASRLCNPAPRNARTAGRPSFISRASTSEA